MCLLISFLPSLFFLILCFFSPPLPRVPLFPTDPEWSLHDSAKRPCSGLYIWGCHVRFSGAAKLGDAFKSQQLPLPRAKAYSFCGLAGLPSERVGNFTQLPQGLHLTCECTTSPACWISVQLEGADILSCTHAEIFQAIVMLSLIAHFSVEWLLHESSVSLPHP